LKMVELNTNAPFIFEQAIAVIIKFKTKII
jgi:hypothetical protein